MAKRTPRKKQVAGEGVSLGRLSFVVGMGLAADDEEGREGRDAAESHLEWWCCWYSVGGVFRCRRRQCWCW
jgi:hypothetical protein